MKVKKQKRHRKAVRFYTACFGFRDPFKVLCDGTFVHHLLVNQIIPADTAVANILGAPVKMFTTRCVLAELKSLGESYSESLSAAQNLTIARCDHEKRKSAVACITEVIAEKNLEHFFVATQDADLRKKFQEIPGVPVIYALRNALFLERPSAVQYQYAKSAEEERLHMSELEYKMLNMRKKKNVATEEERDSADANEGEEDLDSGTRAMRTNFTTKRIDVKDRAQFKRRKAKGPNPLSCKKKKKPEVDNMASRKENSDTTTASSSRKRKRSRRSKNKDKNTDVA